MTSMLTAQHNMAVIQSQLQTLQFENSELTKSLCLKENYLQLKEQQFRVMQKRLEELEASVATWKDKYLQQVSQTQVVPLPAAATDNSGNAAIEALVSMLQTAGGASDGDEVVWVPWTNKLGSSSTGRMSTSNSFANGIPKNTMAQMENLSLTDRNQLKPLVNALRNNGDPSRSASLELSSESLVFQNVSEELSRILLISLLPALMDDAHRTGAALQCFSRTYKKQAMDLKITCSRPEEEVFKQQPLPIQPVMSSTTGPSASSIPASPTTIPEPASTERHPVLRSLSSSANSPPLPPSALSAVHEDLGLDTTPRASSPPSALNMSSPGSLSETHLFDCVTDCEIQRKNVTPVPHGPRVLHATKAVYVSATLTTSNGSSSSAKRRYTVGPSTKGSSSSNNSNASSHEMARTATIADIDHERRSAVRGSFGPAGPGHREGKDGKIKKIVGSFVDRLNRHKPQLPTFPISALSPKEEYGESVCDGCGRGPLTGNKWICRTCRVQNEQEYELCDKCYGQGVHGKENEDALFTRIAEIVITKCPKLASEQELVQLLRVGICKANLKKFSFCLTWIADLLLCRQTKELRARALEISQITPLVRSEFVRLLTDLLNRNRRDIELTTEWAPAANTSAAAIAALSLEDEDDDVFQGGNTVQLDTLRIWVKDTSDSASCGSPATSGTP